MEKIFGENNNLLDYAAVLAVYFLVFLLIFYPKKRVELNFSNNFRALFFIWSIAMLTGNYFGYLGGVMAFLPWLNNFIHSFVWVGFALAWLYMISVNLSWYYRFYLFAMFSFLVKFSENAILGTWAYDPYFFFEGKYAYLIIMSLVDGFYPFISDAILKFLSKKSAAFISPLS